MNVSIRTADSYLQEYRTLLKRAEQANDKPGDASPNPDYVAIHSGDYLESDSLVAHFSNTDERNFVRSYKFSDKRENGPGTPGTRNDTITTFTMADNANLIVEEHGLHLIAGNDLQVSFHPNRVLEINPNTGSLSVLDDNTRFISIPLKGKPQVLNVHQELGDVTGSFTGVVINQL